MNKPPQKIPVVCAAIDDAGGDSVVARHFGMTAWAVSKWRYSLPEKRVLDLAKLTRFKYTPHMLDSVTYPNATDAIPCADPTPKEQLPGAPQKIRPVRAEQTRPSPSEGKSNKEVRREVDPGYRQPADPKQVDQ